VFRLECACVAGMSVSQKEKEDFTDGYGTVGKANEVLSGD